MANITVFDTGAAKYAVAIQGIAGLADISEMPAKIAISAQRAVNATLDRARTMSAQRITDTVAFPKSYLNPSEGRLTVSQYASGENLEGKISARFDATSLARFVVNAPTKRTRGSGVQVKVKPGPVKTIPGGFMINLRNGNQGLAVRSDGPPKNAWKPKPMGNGLWLLYGPSVSQAFSGVREDIAPAAAEFMDYEFNRQMDLK